MLFMITKIGFSLFQMSEATGKNKSKETNKAAAAAAASSSAAEVTAVRRSSRINYKTTSKKS